MKRFENNVSLFLNVVTSTHHLDMRIIANNKDSSALALGKYLISR